MNERKKRKIKKERRLERRERNVIGDIQFTQEPINNKNGRERERKRKRIERKEIN